MSRSRVISLRLTDREYETLSALSTIKDESISILIRQAIGEFVKAQVNSEDYDAEVTAAKLRAQEARSRLMKALDIEETGPIPLVS